MLSLIQDLRHGLRSLASKPGFAIAAILTLALGIGVNTALFSVIKAVVFDPLPYPHAERLVSLAQANTDNERLPINIGYPTFVDWQQQLHSFDSIAVFADWQASLQTPGDAQMLTGMRVSPQYFDVFGVKPMLGRTFTEAEDQSALRDVVVIGARIWHEQFASDPAIVGRKLSVNGRDRVVVGVLPDAFRPAFYGNVAMVPEIWLPLGYRIGDSPACRDCLHLQAVARLKTDADLRAARAELDALAPRLIRDFPDYYPLYSMKEYRYNNITQPNRNRLLWIDPYVDGLKTGHTDLAGYCLVASAKRGERRLVSVILGARSDSVRVSDAQKLLNHGFQAYDTVQLFPSGQSISTLRVWKGATNEVAAGFATDRYLTLPKGKAPKLTLTMAATEPLLAPVDKGLPVGTVHVVLEGKPVADLPLVALQEVPAGSFVTRAWDTVRLWFKQLGSSS